MFVELWNGDLISSTEIARVIKPRTVDGRVGDWFVLDHDGRRCVVAEWEVNKLRLEQMLLPARPADAAVIVTVLDDENEPPQVQTVPIIGWAIHGCTVTSDREIEPSVDPILIESIAVNQRLGILCPDGSVVVPELASYPNREEFAQRVAEEYRERQRRLAAREAAKSAKLDAELERAARQEKLDAEVERGEICPVPAPVSDGADDKRDPGPGDQVH